MVDHVFVTLHRDGPIAVYLKDGIGKERCRVMSTALSTLTPRDLGRYSMRRIALLVDADHFQELCRTVAYAIDPAGTAYQFAKAYEVSNLPTPEEIGSTGSLPQ